MRAVSLLALLAGLSLFAGPRSARNAEPKPPPALREIVVTEDTRLDRNTVLAARLVIKASHVTIDGQGATLQGPGKTGDLKSFENAGPGIIADGCSHVTLRNVKVKGFAVGLAVSDGSAWQVEDCDFSANYHNPAHGWGELPPRGGVLLTRVRQSTFSRLRANDVWNGLHLVDSHDNLVEHCDFSHCSNVCAKLWTARRNRFLDNDLSHGIRIDRAKGEVHARDSTCVLLESGSDDNSFTRNNITHGGDGVFIRSLNGWVSRGNVFVENDTSYANNNCVECWSPGNTFLRNKANHGSYGFWLGGSDQSRLIGNEAAYNGQPSGSHNAPEAGFGHGGIVFVGGSSSHTLLEGNHCHHNNGGGIVFRGDVASQGAAWRSHHWIVQNNRMHDNKWGIWGRWGDWVHVANNSGDNPAGNFLEDVTNLIEVKADPSVTRAPLAVVRGPERALVGRPVVFDASASRDPAGRPLRFRWNLGGTTSDKATLTHTFEKPGFYRVGVTISNGVLADLGWRDVVVAAEVKDELGTEGQAARWGYELEGNDDGKGKMHFADDSDHVLVGRSSLRFTPDPYPGLYATAIYPASRDAAWDLRGKTKLSFWVKFQNPNLPGWQNAGPVITLYGKEGTITVKPVKDGNLLNQLPYSEARWTWLHLSVPLAGDAKWERKETGKVSLERTDAVGIALDSWDSQPFTVWLDGLTFE